MTYRRWRMELVGRIQGIGFRPFVLRLADSLDLSGFVCNQGQGLTIEIQGPLEQLESFVASLPERAPEFARIDSIHFHEIPLVPPPSEKPDRSFKIIESRGPSPLVCDTATDFAPCSLCISELYCEQNRRYLYPMISCTECGPRFSIQHLSPFDRQRTALSDYPLCQQCQTEYQDPSDRRFHSQTIGCFDCGPQWTWIENRTESILCCDAPSTKQILNRFERVVCSGGIVLLKGVGGYQLVCDATCEQATMRIRKLKHRFFKPFAIQVQTHQKAQELVNLSPKAVAELQRPLRPIIVGGRRSRIQNDRIGTWVSPLQNSLGVMLPSSPMHCLLASRVLNPLVVTSANRSGEPMLIDDAEAIAQYELDVDAILTHNRRIVEPLDDPVLCETSQGLVPIRIGRGNTPCKLSNVGISEGSIHAIAVGADLKVAWAISHADNIYLMQYLGDASHPEVLSRLEQSIHKHLDSQLPNPEFLTDMHPGYQTTKLGEKLLRAHSSGSQWMNHRSIQHHVAHLGALAIDQQIQRDKPFFGYVFDGTGYGSDATIWGGELIEIKGADFLRHGHLMHFRIPTGDIAAKYPWRSALSLIVHSGLHIEDVSGFCDWTATSPWGLLTLAEKSLLMKSSNAETLTVKTSSMGRFLDGLSSLLGLVHTNDYEGHAAMLLEDHAWQYHNQLPKSDLRDTCAYRFAINEQGDLLEFDGRGVVKEMLEDIRNKINPCAIAYRIHLSIAIMMADAIKRLNSLKESTLHIGITGGVFQNRLLTELAIRILEQDGHRVFLHRTLPPNDSSIAVGQLRFQTN